MSDSELDLDELLETNPDVDRTDLSDGQEALTALRRAGVVGPSYRLDLPYERGPLEPEGISAEDELAG